MASQLRQTITFPNLIYEDAYIVGKHSSGLTEKNIVQRIIINCYVKASKNRDE